MSTLKQPINYKMLENELDEAIKADELYQLQNEAKIRALEQRVPTYDHFRDMVQTAHLRPLERHEIQKKAEVSWNHCMNKSNETDKLNVKNVRLEKNYDEKCRREIEPHNSVEFLKIWKTLTEANEKFEYLLRFRDQLKDKFFKIEIPSEFLEEFFKLSLELCSSNTVMHIVDILTIFSQCNRFLLSLTMISKLNKENLQCLFEKLCFFMDEDKKITKLNKLAKCYGILV